MNFFSSLVFRSISSPSAAGPSKQTQDVQVPLLRAKDRWAKRSKRKRDSLSDGRSTITAVPNDARPEQLSDPTALSPSASNIDEKPLTKKARIDGKPSSFATPVQDTNKLESRGEHAAGAPKLKRRRSVGFSEADTPSKRRMEAYEDLLYESS